MRTKSVYLKSVGRDSIGDRLRAVIEGHPVVGDASPIAFLFEDSCKLSSLMSLLQENGPRIPNDLILEILSIVEWPALDEIAQDFHKPDFTLWYFEKYGQSVKDAEREKNKLYDKEFARMVRAEKHAQVAR